MAIVRTDLRVLGGVMRSLPLSCLNDLVIRSSDAAKSKSSDPSNRKARDELQSARHHGYSTCDH